MKRLFLEGTYNTRDLGGFPTQNGFMTHYGVFFRSDNLSRLTLKDIEVLKALDVKTIIDLRTEDERQKKPHALATAEDFQYHAIDLIGKEELKEFDITQEIPENALVKLYKMMLLDSRAAIVEVLELLAHAPNNSLFHCSAGKDRTGLISMFLLGLAKVFEADIIASYQVSYTYIKHDPEVQAYLSLAPYSLMASEARYMEEVLTFIKEHYGSIESYLISIGLSSTVIDLLKEKHASK